MGQSQQDPLCFLKTYLDITKVDFQWTEVEYYTYLNIYIYIDRCQKNTKTYCPDYIFSVQEICEVPSKHFMKYK